MYRLSKKLKDLKPLIRELGREKLGNLTKKAKEALDILCEKQKATIVSPNSSAVQEEAEAYERWLYIAGLEEDFLQQRAKLHCLDKGDQNNRTFHNVINSRRAQNSIREIKCQDGNIVSKQSEVKAEAERFFSDFLNKAPDDYEGTSTGEL